MEDDLEDVHPACSSVPLICEEGLHKGHRARLLVCCPRYELEDLICFLILIIALSFVYLMDDFDCLLPLVINDVKFGALVLNAS